MRRRTLSPEIFLHQGVSECSPHARLLFMSLWTQVDRDGRMRWVPLQVHGNTFPHEPDVDIPSMVAELEAKGFLERYSAGGKAYLWLPGFKRWQNPHKNEPPSRLPPPSHESGATPERLDPVKGGRKTKSTRPYIEDQRIKGSKDLKYPDDHLAMGVALSLLEAIESHSPEYSAKVSESRLQGWALEIDRALRLDGYTETQAIAVIRWAHREDPRGFWRGNLLSGSSLRRQLPRLVAQGRAEGWLTGTPGAVGLEGFVEQHGKFLLQFRDRCQGAGKTMTVELLVAYGERSDVTVDPDLAPKLLLWLETRP